MATYIDDIDPTRRDTRAHGSSSPDAAIGGGESPTHTDPMAAEPRRGQTERDIDWAQQSRLQYDQLMLRDEQMAEAQQRTKPSWRELWGASFSLENTLGSMLSHVPVPAVPPMEGYSPFDVAEDGSSDIDGYEQFAPLFSESFHPDTTAALKRQIDQEHKHREVLANAPVRGFLTAIAAGTVDPINLSLMAIPIAGQARVGTTMATAAGSAALIEGQLHGSQMTRTLDESLLNTAGSAVLSGVLGSAINAISRGQRGQLERDVINQVFRDEEPSVRTSDTAPTPSTTASRTPPAAARVETPESVEVFHGRTESLAADQRHRELGVHVSPEAESALDAVGMRFDSGEVEGSQAVLHTMSVPQGNYLRTFDMEADDPARLINIAEDLGISRQEVEDFQHGSFSPEMAKVKLVYEGFDAAEVRALDNTNESVVGYMREHGIDGIVYANEIEGTRSADSFILFDTPTQFREARFDFETDDVFASLESGQLQFDDVTTPPPRPDGPTGSVGAMAASSFDVDMIMNGPLTKMAASMAKITPLGRTIQSGNPTVRQTAAQLVDSRIELQGDYRPTSVESLIRLDYARFDTATLHVRDFQRQWSEATGYDKADFSRELIRAMRRGDESMYPQVQQAAQALRTEMNNLWNKAYELELPGTGRMIPDGEGGEVRAPIETTTAQSYMTRRYDLNVVRNNPERFKRAWMTGIKEQRIRNGDEPLNNDDLYEVATDIYENIVNLREGDLHFQVGPSGAAMLKERVDIRDEFLEEFLVQDWEALMTGYVKSLAPRVRLAETFGDAQWNMKSQLDKINNEYSIEINNLDRKIDRATGKDKKKLVRQRDGLVKKMEADMRDIEIMRDRLLNIAQDPSYMNPENRGILSALRTARSWNIATSLSNIVVASIPDLARVLTYHGGGKVARGIARSAFSREIQRGTVPKNEMARVASAMERASHYRMAHLTEVEDGIVYTRADKYAHKVADAAMTVSGSKHWNSVLKSVVGHLYSDRITRALQSDSPANTKLLRQAGLTDEMIDMARQEARSFATDDDGLWNLNLDRWSNRELVENLEASAIREAEGVIVTPGAGDKPLTMTTEVGRTLFQFMSFMMASTNKTLLPLMQERGGRKWLEILTHVGLGSAVYMLRETLSGRDPSTNPEEILLRGVENTGLAGYGMELYRMGTGLTGLHPVEETGRFNQPVGVQRLLGPTAGMADNMLRLPHSGTSADARAKAARRLMPMQNHYLLRHAYDEVEEQMAEMFGSESNEGRGF